MELARLRNQRSILVVRANYDLASVAECSQSLGACTPLRAGYYCISGSRRAEVYSLHGIWLFQTDKGQGLRSDLACCVHDHHAQPEGPSCDASHRRSKFNTSTPPPECLLAIFPRTSSDSPLAAALDLLEFRDFRPGREEKKTCAPRVERVSTHGS